MIHGTAHNWSKTSQNIRTMVPTLLTWLIAISFDMLNDKFVAGLLGLIPVHLTWPQTYIL